jgi:hypothetical protein
MPYSYTVNAGNGSSTDFGVGFPYIRREHVKVYVNYVDTAFTWVQDGIVRLAPAPAQGVRVEVRRFTPAALPLVDFTDGSTLVAADLDTGNLQHLYLEQELDDALKQTVSINPATGLPSAGGQRITDVGAPSASSDAATKSYVDNFVGQEANIGTFAVTTIKLANNSVTSAKIVDGTIVASDLANDAVTAAKILNSNVTTAKIADANVTDVKLATDSVIESKIAAGAVTNAKIAAGIDGSKISDGTLTASKLSNGAVVTNAEVAGTVPNDTSFYTTSASDLRYFRQDSSETISSGMPWSGNDAYIATTAAIDARIIDLVDDVGGFVPIANETSFPAANPDINNPDGTGTVVSVKEISVTRTPVAGVVTIANGSGSNTVTINGCGSTVLASGYGVLVETTSTLHTYTFHRLVPKATEVTTVAGISGNVTTVAGISGNVTTVANNNANVTTVATNIADIQTVANDLNEPVSEIDTVATHISNVNAVGLNITRVNTVATNIAAIQTVSNDLAEPVSEIETVAFNIANVNTVGNNITNVNTVANNNANVTTVATNVANINTTAGSIANVNTVGSGIANVNTVATNVANVNTVAGISGNVTTVAGISGNVTTVAGISGNVTTVATNTANINTAATYLNAFLALYLGQASADPALDAFGNAVTGGDLYFNNVLSQIRVYNGTAWQSFAENAFGNTYFPNEDFGAVYTAAAGFNTINLGDLALAGGVFPDENSPTNRMSLALGATTYNLGGL